MDLRTAPRRHRGPLKYRSLLSHRKTKIQTLNLKGILEPFTGFRNLTEIIQVLCKLAQGGETTVKGQVPWLRKASGPLVCGALRGALAPGSEHWLGNSEHDGGVQHKHESQAILEVLRGGDADWNCCLATGPAASPSPGPSCRWTCQPVWGRQSLDWRPNVQIPVDLTGPPTPKAQPDPRHQEARVHP